MKTMRILLKVNYILLNKIFWGLFFILFNDLAIKKN
jgi:hypothetical protein